MSAGDLYWVEFPVCNGHAQGGRRPALVVWWNRKGPASVEEGAFLPVVTRRLRQGQR